ncbi:MAG TPA: FHIPEP family type III secretion protein, partial [Desulfatiglandales bacterium]|nr:FHIPEP family type III secretion protein [Desulfatiglandales bacterium]
MKEKEALSSNAATVSEMVTVIGVVGVLVVMIIPLPPMLLDFLLALNITLSIIILLIAMYTLKALDFSIFPSLLLVTTLFR